MSRFNAALPRLTQREIVQASSVIRDGLVCWITGAGKLNSDPDRDVIRDLSERGSNATLSNFAWTPESGYFADVIVNDNVDDTLQIKVGSYLTVDKEYSLEISFEQVTDPEVAYIKWIGTSTGNARFIGLRRAYLTLGAVNIVNWLGIGDLEPPTSPAMVGSILGKHHLIVTASLSEWNFYYKGNLVRSVTFSKTGSFGDVMIFDNNTSNGIKKFFTFRAYNRVLTENEIKQNYEIERTRWGV